MKTICQTQKLFQRKKFQKTYSLGAVKVRALREVTLAIQKGEFLAITGRNGSGKSTLLHQLGLLDIPEKGEIFFKREGSD